MSPLLRVLSVVGVVCALVACSPQPALEAASPSTAAPPAADPHAAHAAVGADLAGLSDEAFDRAFLSMMIPHHEGAIAMSQPVLGSRDPQVRAWAEAIVAAQQAELAQMQTLLEPLGGPDEAAAAPMRAQMQDMSAHAGHAADPERAFVEGMIPHHQSAVDMAALAEGRSENAAVLALARDIIAAQQKEMAEFREYLKR